MKYSSGSVSCTCRYWTTDTGYAQYIDKECEVHRPRIIRDKPIAPPDGPQTRIKR